MNKQKQTKNKGRRLTKRPVIRKIPAAYNVREPPLKRQPQFSKSNEGTTIISHEEEFYVFKMSEYEFSIQNSRGFPGQPGRSESFPWGSSVSRAWENYRFRKLKYKYYPACATTHDGIICMFFDFDSRDGPPQSFRQMRGNQVSNSCAVYEYMEMQVPAEYLAKKGKDMELFIRIQNQDVVGGDLKTYDCGRLWIASGGAAHADAGKVGGRFFVEYELELMSPQYSPVAIIKSNSARIDNSSASKAAPLTGATVVGGLDVRVNDATHFVIGEPGAYMVQAFYSGTGMSAGDVTVTPQDTSQASATATTDVADGVAEAVTYLINQPQAINAIYTIAAAGATSLTGLYYRFAKYTPSSTQTYSDLGVVNALNETPVAYED